MKDATHFQIGLEEEIKSEIIRFKERFVLHFFHMPLPPSIFMTCWKCVRFKINSFIHKKWRRRKRNREGEERWWNERKEGEGRKRRWRRREGKCWIWFIHFLFTNIFDVYLALSVPVLTSVSSSSSSISLYSFVVLLPKSSKWRKRWKAWREEVTAVMGNGTRFSPIVCLTLF